MIIIKLIFVKEKEQDIEGLKKENYNILIMRPFCGGSH
jgi:hypothetical protein